MQTIFYFFTFSKNNEDFFSGPVSKRFTRIRMGRVWSWSTWKAAGTFSAPSMTNWRLWGICRKKSPRYFGTHLSPTGNLPFNLIYLSNLSTILYVSLWFPLVKKNDTSDESLVPGAVPGVGFMLIASVLCLPSQFENCTFCRAEYSEILPFYAIWQKIGMPCKLSGKTKFSVASCDFITQKLNK